MTKFQTVNFGLLTFSLLGGQVHAQDKSHGTQTEANADSLQSRGCPKTLVNEITKEDKNRTDLGWGGFNFTVDKNCSQNLQSTLRNPQDLENFFAQNPATTLGLPSGFLVNACRKAFDGKISDETLTKVVGDYYLSMNRLKRGAQASVEALAGTQSLLAKSPKESLLKDFKCSPSLPGSCTEAKQDQACKASPQSLGALSANISVQLTALKAIDKQIAVLQQTRDNTNGGLSATQNKELDSLKNKAFQISQVIPFASGGPMSAYINRFRADLTQDSPSASELKAAVKQQLVDNEKALNNSLGNMRAASECLNGDDPGCYRDDWFNPGQIGFNLNKMGAALTGQKLSPAEETLDAMPPLDFNDWIKNMPKATADGSTGKQRSAILRAVDVLNSAECRQASRASRDKANEYVSDQVLTIAVMAFATPALRIIESGLNTVGEGGIAFKSMKLANETLIGKAKFGAGAAKAAGSLANGIDQFWLGFIGAGALDACAKAAFKPMAAQAPQHPSCQHNLCQALDKPVAPQSQGCVDDPAMKIIAASDYTSCIVAAGTASLPLAGPAVMGALKKFGLTKNVSGKVVADVGAQLSADADKSMHIVAPAPTAAEASALAKTQPAPAEFKIPGSILRKIKADPTAPASVGSTGYEIVPVHNNDPLNELAFEVKSKKFEIVKDLPDNQSYVALTDSVGNTSKIRISPKIARQIDDICTKPANAVKCKQFYDDLNQCK